MYESITDFPPVVNTLLNARQGKAARALLSRSAVRRETTHLGIRLRRILRCAAGGASWTRPFGIPSFLRAFLRAEKGVGLSLYRLPDHCHADSPIPAARFFRKEKSSLLPAGGTSCAASRFLYRPGSIFRSVCADGGDSMLLRESFHHRRPSGPTAVPSPIRSEGTSGAWQGCRRQAVALTERFRAWHSVSPRRKRGSDCLPALEI